MRVRDLKKYKAMVDQAIIKLLLINSLKNHKIL